MSQHAHETLPVIGILGGGQLGRMMALAAIRMGIGVRFLVPRTTGSMEGLGAATVADWHDDDVMRRWASGLAAITVESEWAPAERARSALNGGIPVWPSPATLEYVRHKGKQKDHLLNSGLPVPPYRNCATLEEARTAVADFGFPVVVKQFKRSYDGYGNATVRSDDELDNAWKELSAADGLMVEAFIDFVQELSVLVARRPGGQHVVYPVAYTEQRDHRCHAVAVPAEADPLIISEARRIGLAAVEAVGGVGLTAVELFHTIDNRILVNELAPRPHNTGHYTIEGCYTSQFENHVRGILDLPLGNPELRENVAVMVNVLGMRTGTPSSAGYREALAVTGAAVHLYGKSEVKPKRKMGHVTVCGYQRDDVRRRAEKAAALIEL